MNDGLQRRGGSRSMGSACAGGSGPPRERGLVEPLLTICSLACGVNEPLSPKKCKSQFSSGPPGSISEWQRCCRHSSAPSPLVPRQLPHARDPQTSQRL